MAPAAARTLQRRRSEHDDAGERAFVVTIAARPVFAGGDRGDSKRVRVIVSWNELQRTCRKAFRGLGVPAGADDDGSFAVLWLQARGLDALTPLDAALSALEHATPHPLACVGREAGVDVLDAGGQPSVSVASDAVDFAIARAVQGGARTDVLLTGVEGAIFAAGTLAQRPVPGRCGRVEWRDREGQFRLDMASDGACRLLAASTANVTESGAGLDRQSVRIAIGEPDRGKWMQRGQAWRTLIDEADFERRATQSVTRGIEIPDVLWTRLLAFAKRTLVPATHASRERGAGGGEYND